jgi:hypothetical protein
VESKGETHKPGIVGHIPAILETKEGSNMMDHTGKHAHILQHVISLENIYTINEIV